MYDCLLLPWWSLALPNIWQTVSEIKQTLSRSGKETQSCHLKRFPFLVLFYVEWAITEMGPKKKVFELCLQRALLCRLVRELARRETGAKHKPVC